MRCAVIARKKNVRVLEVPLPGKRATMRWDLKRIGGGFLVQTADTRNVERADLTVVTRVAPDAGAGRRSAVRVARRLVRQVQRDRLLRGAAARSASARAR